MNGAPELKPEIDFHDLRREPVKLFGYSYMYFLGALVVLGILYLLNLTTVGKNRITPVALSDSTALARDIPLVMPSVLPPVDVQKAGLASDEAVARGKELFSGTCVACHGENGQGDGPSAPTLNPKPRNFHSLDGWKNGSKVSQIYRTLEDGIPGTGMASFRYLAPADRFALAHFVRTFAPGQPVDTRDDLQGLETQYQLSKGMNRPGQIPVIKAERLVIAEHAADVLRVAAIVRRVDEDREDRGAALLRSQAWDEGRMATALVLHGRPVGSGADFVGMVSRNPRLFGLRPSVNGLSPDDWQALFAYVAKLRKEES